MKPSNPTQALAFFIATLAEDRIPAAQLGFARLSMLDWLGCCLAGTREPAVRALEAVMEPMAGAAQATVIARGRKSSLLDAALLNGAAGNLLDLDDVHPALIGHPTSVIAPTVLALGEWLGTTGAQASTAYVAGYEVMVRVGKAVEPELYDRGWHATGVLGVFGSCAAAAKMLGLNQTHTVAALAIAASQAAGLRELFGTSSKCIHHGKAAMAGILACLWARQGVDSAANVIGGRYGLRTFSEPLSLDAIVERLGEDFHLAQTCYKRHAACGSVHAAVDAAMELRRQPGFVIERIERIEVRTHKLAYDLTIDNAQAATGLAAKYSMHYSLALAFIEGHASLELFTDAKVAEPQVRSMAERVHMSIDPQMKYIEAMPSEVTVVLTDGHRMMLRIDAPKGRPSNPMGWDDIAAKFKSLAAPTLDCEQMEQVIACLANFHETPIRSLMPLLAKARG
jgi:2-methylcitrate dehydratase PrpD